MLRTGCSQESLPSSLLCLGSYLKAKSSQAALAAPREASLKAYLDGNLMPFESGVDCIAKPASNLRGDFLSFQKFYHLSFFFFFPQKITVECLLCQVLCWALQIPGRVKTQGVVSLERVAFGRSAPGRGPGRKHRGATSPLISDSLGHDFPSVN